MRGLDAMVYSHSHIDHIGYAGDILKTNPSMIIVAHEETRKLLARAKSPDRPVPRKPSTPRM